MSKPSHPHDIMITLSNAMGSDGNVLRLRLISEHPLPCWILNTPYQKISDVGTDTKIDAEIVFDNIPPKTTCWTAQTHDTPRVLCIAEPPKVLRYPRRYLGQFDAIITPYHLDVAPSHVKQIITAPLMPMQYGWSYDAFDTAMTHAILKDTQRDAGLVAAKQPKLSVVISTKTITPEQKARLDFVYRLKDVLGDRLVIRGRGFEMVDDKREVIDPYAYHLVLENNRIENFWTEKLIDPLMGLALPFYAGCPNLTDYFDSQSFIPIDFSNDTIQMLDRVTRDLGFYHEHQEALQRAKAHYLDKWEPMARLARIKEEFGGGMSRDHQMPLRPIEAFDAMRFIKYVTRPTRKWLRSLRDKARRAA